MRAVITGATSGIGKEMAVYLHKRGWELVLTGRNSLQLARMAKQFGNHTRWIALDLAQPDAPYALHDFCKGMQIDLLVNNAGFGQFGEFTKTPLDRELAMLDVNVRAVHILTKLFLKDFQARNRGRILNVASIAGFMTGPLMSGYYAGKSYIVRLSLAIREELRRAGSSVTISLLCPGPVDTNFNRRAGVVFSLPSVDVKQVAALGIEGALAGKAIIIPGTLIHLLKFGIRFCPETILSAIIYQQQKRKGGA